MGLFKSSDNKKQGLSLLQGLLILAVIGIVAAVVVAGLKG
jgi:Tfp pilus assembly protein FimT